MSDFSCLDGQCRMCKRETMVVVNINLEAVHICNSCCKTIMLQTTRWLADNNYPSSEVDGMVCSKCLSGMTFNNDSRLWYCDNSECDNNSHIHGSTSGGKE